MQIDRIKYTMKHRKAFRAVEKTIAWTQYNSWLLA